jgi:sugar/nucleoside kinase (ribokinase family)
LANGPPLQQSKVLDQLAAPRLTVLDTMNLWIETQREALIEVIRRVDMVTINEGEARLLARTPSLVRAAREILALGPKAVLIKRGEAGAVMFSDGTYFVAPAYPLEEVCDPTGAGDSFAGGFMGYLAKVGRTDADALKRAVIHGSAVASFTVEAFSLDRLRTLTLADVEARYREFRYFTAFEPA